MLNKRFTFSALLILFIISSACHTAKRAAHTTTQENDTRHPLFIEDIAIRGNGQNSLAVRSGRNNASGRQNTQKTGNSVAPPAQEQALPAIQEKYSRLLGVEAQALKNISLYHFVDEWMGVHYKFGGTDKSGIDCSALVQKLYEHVYCTNLVRTAFEQFNFCKLIFDTQTLKEGDLVFFRIRHRKISHVGVYLANNYFVHASLTQGVMISSLSEPYWQKYFAGAGQVPKRGL